MLNIMTGIGGYFINTVLGFVCRTVFIRCLSVDYLGVNGLFTNILSMLSLAELGIGSAIVYALYRPIAERNEKKIASLVKVYQKAYMMIGMVVAGVGIMLMPFLGVIIREQPHIDENIYVLYLLNLINVAGTYFFSYRSSLLTAAQMNYIVSGLSYLISMIQSVIQMVYLVLTRDYLGYLLIQTVGIFVYNILVSHLASKYFPYINDKNIEPLSKDETRALFCNVRDLGLYKISGLLVNSTDNILITFFNGLSATGITSNYTLLVNTLNSLLSQVFHGFTSSIGNHNVMSDDGEKYELFSCLNLLSFWIYGWAALGITFCASDIVQLFFGADYVLPMEIPVVMAINFYVVGMMGTVWTYKHTLGLFRYGRFLQLVTGTVNIILSVILGSAWGVVGILLATFAARMLTSMWYDPYIVFRHGFRRSSMDYIKKHISYCLVLLLAAAIIAYGCQWLQGPVVPRLVAKMALCSVAMNVVFLCAFCRSKEMKRISAIWKRGWAFVRRKRPNGDL